MRDTSIHRNHFKDDHHLWIVLSLCCRCVFNIFMTWSFIASIYSHKHNIIVITTPLMNRIGSNCSSCPPSPQHNIPKSDTNTCDYWHFSGTSSIKRLPSGQFKICPAISVYNSPPALLLRRFRINANPPQSVSRMEIPLRLGTYSDIHFRTNLPLNFRPNGGGPDLIYICWFFRINFSWRPCKPHFIRKSGWWWP